MLVLIMKLNYLHYFLFFNFSLNKTKKKLKELGINYDFFMPVDIPEELTEIE